MTSFAAWYTLALSGYHEFPPERFLPLPLLVQVCKVSNVVHVHLFLDATDFACVFEESFDSFRSHVAV